MGHHCVSSCVYHIQISDCLYLFLFFFFNDTATTEIYTLSLHDALPISGPSARAASGYSKPCPALTWCSWTTTWCCRPTRSEEHTSELQSQSNLVCRLLLEKKNSFFPFKNHSFVLT